LEVGCGDGSLWTHNADRIPKGCTLVLSDASPGMAAAARATLAAADVVARVEVAEAEDLSSLGEGYDLLVANHMLYHVPDRRRAIREFRRVLAPSGRLVASTNGREHMRELDRVVVECVGRGAKDETADAFGLENGAPQLRESFGTVRLERRSDALEIDDAEALVAYALSLPPCRDASPAAADRLRRALEALVARDGTLRVAKDSGLFVATGFAA
jgi:SAM-dependent methyltransferase